MKKPRNESETPGDRFRYRQPETDMRFREIHPRALEQAVFRHRLSLPDMHLDTSGGWQARLWNDICAQDEHLDCVDTENPGRWANLSDVWNWAQSMAGWAATGLSVVPQEEAERRASICVECPHNKAVSGCFGCHGVGEVISALAGGKTTSKDANLQQCAVCHGCMLSAKVWLPLEAIKSEPYRDNLPSFCWLREQAE